jgi:hypothetical protein
MSCFNTVSNVSADGTSDLTKHVNFTAGMILGVDDFTQEFAYLAGRDRWLARDLLGYGTVSGLRVTIEEDAAKGFRVMIAPGVAVSPRGQFICVPAAQCAYLNQWLAAAKPEDLLKNIKHGGAATSPPISSPPIADGDEITLYVTLCWRDCLPDNVPIPGEPCRSEDELTAASRIKDDFSLELRFEPPKQSEEKAVRDYVEYLKQIEVTETGASTPLEGFINAIRDRWLNAPASPPIFSSPPLDLQIHADDFCEYLRAAFRLWTTELRNFLSDRKTGCGSEMTGGAELADCVLLAELRVPLTPLASGWKVSDTDAIEINETNRPFLLHLRMLQEWMLCGCQCAAETIPPIVSPPITSPPTAHNHTLDALSDVTVPTPAEGQILIFRSGEWIAENPPTTGGTTDHGALNGLGDDDHPQYLLADGSRALTGNLNGGGRRITNLAAANANGQAVIFQQAIKQADAADGDLSGTFPNPTVSRLQGRTMAANAPNVGEALIWNGTAWTPQVIPQTPTQPPKPQIILPLATVTRVDVNIYEIWFNIDAPENLAQVVGFKAPQLLILDETDTPTPFISPIRFRLSPDVRNVFIATLVLDQTQPEPDRMRFKFDVEKTIVEFNGNQTPLIEYADKNDIKFEGYLSGKFATVFVRGLAKRG